MTPRVTVKRPLFVHSGNQAPTAKVPEHQSSFSPQPRRRILHSSTIVILSVTEVRIINGRRTRPMGDIPLLALVLFSASCLNNVASMS